MRWNLRNPFEQESRQFKLDGPGIDGFSELLETLLKEQSVERQNRLRIRLSFEEACLCLRDRFGSDRTFTFVYGRRFGRPFLELVTDGPMFNPLGQREKDVGVWSGTLLTMAGAIPTYRFDGGHNVIRVDLPVKRMNPILKILIFVLAGVVLGMLGLAVLNDPATVFLCIYFLSPLKDIWVRILTAISGPVIFLMILATVLNTGTIAEQGGDNKVSLARYFVFSALAGMITILPASWIYGMRTSWAPPSREAIETVMIVITHFIPEDVLDAVSMADAPQLLVIALVLGNALIVIGRPVEGLTSICRQSGLLAQKLSEWISRLVPYFTAILICMEILRDQTSMLYGLWQVLLISLLISAALVLLTILVTSLRIKVPMRILFRKLWKPFITAIRAGSVEASFGTTEKSCIQELGIEERFVKVSLPHGIVLYMPVNLVGILCFLGYASVLLDVRITIVGFVIAMLFAVVLFVATPPVPGANLLAYMALFIQFDISADMLGDAMIFDVIFSTFAAAGNQAMLQMELVLQSSHLGLLNRDILLMEPKNKEK